MKISDIITDKYKLRMPPTVYYELLADVVEAEEEREPKTGHWIADEVQLPDRVILNYHCSVCGRKLVGYSTKTLKDAPYCHCGAKMVEPQESE